MREGLESPSLARQRTSKRHALEKTLKNQYLQLDGCS